MISLKISMPVRPWRPNFPQRRVYRVVLDNGYEISLTTLAAKLGISRSTLFSEIVCASLDVGTHTTAFHECMARAKRKNRVFSKTVKCPHCKGRGRIASDLSSASGVAAATHQDALNNFGEESADSAGIT